MPLGLITTSNFYVPQVNRAGSMATFIVPSGIPRSVKVSNANLKRGLGFSGNYWRIGGLGQAPGYTRTIQDGMVVDTPIGAHGTSTISYISGTDGGYIPAAGSIDVVGPGPDTSVGGFWPYTTGSAPALYAKPTTASTLGQFLPYAAVGIAVLALLAGGRR